MDNSFELVAKAKKQIVAKRNDMIQNSCLSLVDIENKAISYILSKVQPNDKPGTIYTFNCKEFYALIGWRNQHSYTGVKRMLEEIKSKKWWIDLGEEESLVEWFTIARAHKKTGNVSISFHPDLEPFIFELQRQRMENGIYYTSFQLQNITLMKNKYSPRIYEILKSYQYNNKQWMFELGTDSKHDLFKLIALRDQKTGEYKIPATWGKNIAVFERDVLNPVKEEINKYTDIKIDYALSKIDFSGIKHRRNCVVEFYMLSKTAVEQQETENIIDAEYREIDSIPENETKTAFFQEHEKKVKEEKKTHKNKQKKEDVKKEEIKEPEVNEPGTDENEIESYWFNTHCSIMADVFPQFTKDQILALYYAAIPNLNPFDKMDKEVQIIDYITPKWSKIVATPDQTKSTPYLRLLNAVSNNF